MTMHERIRYSCDKCDYIRTQVKNLKEHIKTKHNGAPDNICGYSFGSFGG